MLDSINLFFGALMFGGAAAFLTFCLFILASLACSMVDWPKWVPFVVAIALGIVFLMFKGGWELMSYYLATDSPPPLEFDLNATWAYMKDGVIGEVVGIVVGWFVVDHYFG